MNMNERLQSVWEAETGESVLLDSLTRKVRRQRRRLQLRRVAEILLTLAAIIVFAHALLSQTMSPAHWVLLPFFIVFLPTVWTLILRAPRQDATELTAPTNAYARVRIAQLQSGLRELWIANRTAQALFAYSVAFNVATWWFGDPEWIRVGLGLLAYSMIWLGASLLFARTMGRRREEERRNLLSLLED